MEVLVVRKRIAFGERKSWEKGIRYFVFAIFHAEISRIEIVFRSAEET